MAFFIIISEIKKFFPFSVHDVSIRDTLTGPLTLHNHPIK